MADFDRHSGFWETFANSAQNTLGDYEKLKEQKRLRAMQKLKFIMENSDVGSQVDPTAAQEIQDYAPEGNPYIQGNTFAGTPDQQRVAEFRKFAEENPDVDEDTYMKKGMTAGAVSPGSYSSYISGRNAQEARRQDMILRLREQKAMQEDRQANQENMVRLAAALRQGGRGGDDSSDPLMENKVQRQKWATARKTYGGDPYSFITQRLLNDPSTAAQELAAYEGSNFSAEDEGLIDNPDAWQGYQNYHMRPDVRANSINQYGLKPNEYEALLSHIQGITNKKKAKNAGNTKR